MQTTYNLTQEQAVVGQMVDAYDVANDMVLSGHATVAAIPFGRGMTLIDGSNYVNGYKFRLPTVADVDEGGEGDDDTISVMLSLRDLQRVTGQYEKNDTVAAMVMGKMWVETEEDVVQADCEDGEVWCRVDGVVEVHKITIDADLVTGNVITATVNETVCTEAMADHADDHDATMTAFAAKIAACSGIASAALEGGDNYEITITSDMMGEHITITDEAITGGATQSGFVLTEVSHGVPRTDCGKFRKSDDLANPGTFAKAEGLMWLAPHKAGMAPVMCFAIGGGGDDNNEQPQT